MYSIWLSYLYHLTYKIGPLCLGGLPEAAQHQTLDLPHGHQLSLHCTMYEERHWPFYGNLNSIESCSILVAVCWNLMDRSLTYVSFQGKCSIFFFFHKKEEKEDFIVAHVVNLSSENGICFKLNLKQISFSGLRLTMCASACINVFVFCPVYSFLSSSSSSSYFTSLDSSMPTNDG